MDIMLFEKELIMIKRLFSDLRRYFPYSVAAARAQLKAEVADSYLNWIWWVLDPLCFMLIYTFIFGYVFKSSEQYFPVYIFIGLSMWTFFDRTLQGSVKLIKANKAVVSKVYFPKFVLLMTRIWINGFKMMVSFGIVAVMMLIWRIPLTWNVLYALPVFLTLGLLAFGIGCILMHWGVYVNDLANVVSIVLKMMFYMTGIFYNVEKRIPEYGAALARYNPAAYLLNAMRGSLIYGQTPNLKWLALWLAAGIALSLLGAAVVYRAENNYVKAI